MSRKFYLEIQNNYVIEKRKMSAWFLAQAVILFLAMNLMRSGLSLVFF
jgi:hypothetical protein